MARKTKKNGANQSAAFSHFYQDIIGILLIALAIFILVSNLTSSTGIVGFYVVRKFLGQGLGVGVLVLPLFIALFGIVLMIRQEIGYQAARLVGLTLLFLTFITSAQFYSDTYFASSSALYSGGGGLIGYVMRMGLEKTIGLTGSYILLGALAAISLLFIFNVTVIKILSALFDMIMSWVDAFGSFDLLSLLLSRFGKKKDKQERPFKPSLPVEVRPAAIAAIPVGKEISEPKEEHKEERREDIDLSRGDLKLASDIPATKPQKGSIKGYKLPPIDLLDQPSAKDRQMKDRLREATEARKRLLEDVLASFGVAARIVEINQGPAVTRFELQPEPGVKVSKISSLADDIAVNLAAHGVRIEAPVPGKSVVGIEIPNQTIMPVRLGEIVKAPEFMRSSSKLFLALGKDLTGTPIFGDLKKMPHLLIAGTTGSGKSVCINSLIISILLKARPDEVKFIMIDPKMVELTNYDGIPHLLAPVVTESKRAALTLKEWVTGEMDRRYRMFHAAGARNLEAFNAKQRDTDAKLPYIVVIIDELADLMMVAATEVETSICRIAQMARATGIHLVIATQRPSVDVITGLIKANIPSRIAFAVATQVDSRVILDGSGAEKLLGRGDMLYHPIGAMKSVRLQGSFVSDNEIEKVIKFIREQAPPQYVEEIVELKAELTSKSSQQGDKDELFSQAALIIVEGGQASTSHLQRRLRIGYNRAARLMDEMEAAGVVSKSEGENKPRRILANRETLKNLGVITEPPTN